MECYILKFELNVEVWNPIVEVHSITPNEVIIKSCTTIFESHYLARSGSKDQFRNYKFFNKSGYF